MNTPQEELAGLRERHAAELRRVEEVLALKLSLPSPPRHAYRQSDGETWVSYGGPWSFKPEGRPSLARVLELLTELPPTLAEDRIRGCRSIAPPARMAEEYRRGELCGVSLVSLVCEMGRGFGPDWVADWFSDVGGPLRVKVELNPPRTVRAYVRVRSWHHGEPNQIENYAEDIAGARLASWGGGSRDAGRWSWHFADLAAFAAFCAAEGQALEGGAK